MAICYLSIGSNLGNRRKNIKLAVKRISILEDTQILKESKCFDTLPVGGPDNQRNYLNAALKIQTKISPLNLLKKLKNIEKGLGRVATVRFGPRIIDLDILLYADKLIKSRKLTVPHPRMFKRDFVIRPLSEVL
ncbi:MAG: 2-amino-4-hydroxy-6-hydroxymethyldihydropteridine diphosphokinase [Candidatus Omnitrophota bacterium]